MAYILTAFDKNHRVVMESTETSKSAAYIGFDIWCDGSLDETGTLDYVDLLDAETGEVLLSGKVVRIDRDTAISRLMEWGWNRKGAEEIVVKGYIDGVLGDEEDLRRLHEDYKSR